MEISRAAFSNEADRLYVRRLCRLALRLSACLVGLLALFSQIPAFAKADYINSVLAAINSANGQARLSLKQGFYKATSGTTSMIVEVPSAMASVLKFDYQNRSLVSGLWEFDRDIFVSIYLSNGKCVKIKARKFVYREGGFVQDSEQTIVPDGPCRESEPLSWMNDFLRLSDDPGDLFRGSVFVGMEKIKRCRDANCNALEAGLPVRRAEFFGSSSNGAPLDALKASFKEGSRILLPKNGLLVLGRNSEAIFNGLVYDLDANTGSALLNRFNVVVTDGLISGGQTIVRIKSQSSLTAEEVKFERDDASVKITRGSLSGELGEGTSILLSNDVAKTSTLNIRYAKASLAGLSYDGSGSGATLGILRGVLSTQLENGEIWFTDRNSIRVGYTNINVVLGCPEAVALNACSTPVTWGPSGLAVRGTINAFATTLVGGQFNIANVGTVQLKAGQIAADNLTIDSTNKSSPVTGKVNKFEVVLEGQDLHLDGTTIARVARAEVKANDLIYKLGQSLPIGHVDIEGSATGIEGGKIGKVRFDAGAKFNFKIERRDADDPELVDGTIAGSAKALLTAGNYVNVAVNVDKLRYYRGHGDAKVKLTATDGSYVYETPSAYKTESEAGFEAQINLKPVKLAASLAQPIVLATDVKASNKSWSMEPVVGIPYKLRVGIAPQELIYAPIKTPVGGTLCAPKVNLPGQAPEITGKIDAFASNLGGRIRIYDNALAPGVAADADDRGCSKIGALVCFLVGSAFGGPIGGAALAVLCKGEIDDGKRELSDKIRDESVKKVAESKFEFDY